MSRTELVRREALIDKYASAAKRNAAEMQTMPIEPIRQHFREFADELAALEGDAQPVAVCPRCEGTGRMQTALRGFEHCTVCDAQPVAECATDGCERPATCRFERKGVGSYYCGECFGKVIEAVDRATPPSPKLGVAVEDDLEQIKKDAERWNALLRCARIRMFGSAGFDPKTGERHEYNNATSQYEKSSEGWVHFGAEFWSVYPGHEDEDRASRWGTVALTALADDVLLKEKGEALSQLEKPGE